MTEQIDKQAIEEMANILEQAKIDARATIGSMNYGFGMWYAKACYNAGYRKQSEIADDIIAIIEQRMARNIERLNGCQSDIWKVGYLAENKAYQDIKEIIEQRMKGGAE